MSARIALVTATHGPLGSTGRTLWRDASGVRGLHRPGWSGLVFDYSGRFEGNLTRVRALAAEDGVSLFHLVGPLSSQPPGLLVSDVDSTMTRCEGIDLLAETAGRAQEVADLTAGAMAGELDFTESLRARVACLAGLPVGALEEATRAVTLTPGAADLVASAHRVGARVGLVSGGFTAMVGPLARQIGADSFAANELEVIDGHLTGQLSGPVVDRAAKAAWLRRWAGELDVPLCRTVAVGDGANDIDMLTTAGLGVGLCPKPAAREVADATLEIAQIDALSVLWER